jgi:hypothetical protein
MSGGTDRLMAEAGGQHRTDSVGSKGWMPSKLEEAPGPLWRSGAVHEGDHRCNKGGPFGSEEMAVRL